MTQRRSFNFRDGRVAGALIVIAIVGAGLPAMLCGCPSAHAPELDISGVVARVESDRISRRRMTATVRARRDGVEGFLARTDLEVAAERPARLHIMAPSFFGPPMFVVTAAEVDVVIFDGRTDPPSWAKGPVDANVLHQLMSIPLTVDDLTDLLLGSCPALPENPTVRRADDVVIIGGLRPDGTKLEVDVGATDDVVRSIRMTRGTTLVRITLENHARVGQHEAPRDITVSFDDDGASQTIVLEVKQLVLNGAPLPATTFEMEIPEGVIPGPLSTVSLAAPAP